MPWYGRIANLWTVMVENQWEKTKLSHCCQLIQVSRPVVYRLVRFRRNFLLLKVACYVTLAYKHKCFASDDVTHDIQLQCHTKLHMFEITRRVEMVKLLHKTDMLNEIWKGWLLRTQIPSCNKVKNKWKVPEIAGLNRVATETMETAEVEQWIKIRVFWSTSQVIAITIYI